jgi:hypothetical protein
MRRKVLIVALAVGLLTPHGTMVGGTLYVIAIDGQPVPDGNGVYDFGAVVPVINERGVVSFYTGVGGSAAGVASSGQFAAVPGMVTQVVRKSQTVPVSGVGNIWSLDGSGGSINSEGWVALKALGTSDAKYSVYRKEPGQNGFRMIARAGDPAPGEGNYGSLNSESWRPVLGAAGHVAFYANLTGTSGGTLDNSAIFVSNSNGTAVSRVVQKGDIVADGTEAMVWFSLVPALNPSGRVAFVTGFSTTSTDAILSGDGITLDLIARSTTAPAGPGEAPLRDFAGTDEVMMNSYGMVAFTARAEFPVNGFQRVVMKAGVGTPQVVAVSGMEVSGGYTLGSINAHPCINDAGLVAYEARINGTSGNGLLIGDTLIAKNGDPLPGGIGTFFSFNQHPFALNQSGQLAFEVQINVPVLGYGNGLFFYDPPGGLQEIARLGTPFLGSTITDVGFAGTTTYGVLPPGMNGLNDSGEVAFLFELADDWCRNHRGIQRRLSGEISGDSRLGLSNPT